MKNLFLLIGLTFLMLSCNQNRNMPVIATAPGSPVQEHEANIQNEKENVNIEMDGGSISIADILADREKYNGKIVTVKGKVTKYNPAILNKNWVHIQDGTEFSGGYDLTITTEEATSVGELVSFKGKIILDKDFGYGYFYSTLMEDAKLIR